MRKSTIYLFFLGVVMIGAMACAGLVVSAQDNSNTAMTNGNSNSKPRRTGRRRGTKKTANANTADQSMSNANMSDNANMASPRRGRRGRRGRAKTGETAMTGQASMATPKKTGRCDPTQQEQTDLSGTYTGKAKHGTEAPVDSTLTITGTNFTITAGPETHTGRLTAVTTCGYTAVTMMMGDLTPPTPSPNPPAALPAMSLRAKKVGDKLWLTSVPGEKMSVSFTPTGGSMKPRPRKHRAKPKTDATTAPPKTTP